MQVFVPYPEPIKVVECLDHNRRNKQLIEVKQILAAIDGNTEAWKNHPVVKMYAPYREWLDRYRLCFEHWIGGREETARWWSNHANLVRPDFLTEEFCDQHKRRLYTKAPDKYKDFAKFGKTNENWYFLDGVVVKYIDGKRA
jgi:hypothetical protein